MSEANTTVLSLSLREYKKQIDDLRAQLAQLDKSSEEYRQTASKVREMQNSLNQAMKVGKEANEAAKGSYNDLKNQMAALRKEWAATNDEAKRNELGQQMEALNTQLKELDGSIGNFQRNVGNYEGAVTSMKSSMREWIQEMAELDIQGQGNSQRYLELAEKVGAYKDAMADAQAVAGQFADDTRALDAALDVAKTGTALFGLWEGAMSAFGLESEGAAKAIQKLNAVMLILNSLQTIQTALTDKASKTYQALAAVYTYLFGVKKKDVKVTTEAAAAEGIEKTQAQGLTGAITAEAGATEAATVATNLWKKALMATGIGALIVALGTLVGYLLDLATSFKSSSDSAPDFADNMERASNEAQRFTEIQEQIIQQKLDFGEITDAEAAKEKLSLANDELERMKGNLDKIAETKVDLGNFKDYANIFAGMGEDLENLSYDLRNSTSNLEDQRKVFGKYSVTASQLPNIMEDIKKAMEDDTFASKRFGKVNKDQLQNSLNMVNALIAAYQALGGAIDANSNSEEEKRKAQEEAEKKAEEAKRKREEAARKRKEALKEAQDKENKSIEEHITDLEREGKKTQSQIKYEKELLKAKNKLDSTTEYKLTIKSIDAEIASLKQLETEYTNASKNSKLSADQRKKWAQKAADINNTIEEKTNEKIVADATETAARMAKAFTDKMQSISDAASEISTAVTFQFNIAESGIDTTDWPKKLQEKFHEAIKKAGANLTDIGKDLGLGDKFNVLEYLTDKDGNITGVKVLINEIQQMFATAKKVYGDNFQEFIDLTQDDMDVLYGFFENKTKGNALEKQLKAIIDIKGLNEDLGKFTEIVSNLRKNSTFSDIFTTMFGNVAKKASEDSSITKSVSTYVGELNNMMREAANEGNGDTIEAITSIIKELEKTIPGIQSYFDTLQSMAKLNADYIIGQNQRIDKSNTNSANKDKQALKNRRQAYLQFSSSVSNLAGIVNDAYMSNLEAQEYTTQAEYDNAKEKFENAKTVQKALVVLDTLTAGIGAYFSWKQPEKTPGVPAWLQDALGVADMAATVAAGWAQWKQIDNTKFGGSMSSSSSSSASNGVSSINVSNLLSENIDSASLTALSTSTMANNQNNIRCYVLESDISKTQGTMKTRVTDSTF